MWSYAGAGLAFLLAAGAWARSLRPGSNYYETSVYAMGPGEHRRYAVLGAAFAALFLASVWVPLIPAVPLLAIFTVIAILYGSTFLRGASGEDEDG